MRYLLLTFCLLLGTSALAQQAEDDRGFLTGLIEDAVSDLGREVRLMGFEGALSSRATVQAITIADETGVWLRLEEVGLQWTRSALLSGQIQIEELAAERIILSRVPEPAGGAAVPSAQATPFFLPDLPVSVEIGEVRAERIEIAEVFLGEPLAARLQGALSLVDGLADAELTLARVDDKIGRFVLDTRYDESAGQLALSLLAEEGKGGIAARMLGLPDRPALRLEITGDAPISAFDAELALSTDGAERVMGRFQLGHEGGAAETVPAETAPDETWFNLALTGDLRPLLQEDYHPFFGPSSSLLAFGLRDGDGALDLTSLSIEAEQLTLGGSARIGAGGWPEAFDLTGRMAAADGEPVRLPVSGPRTEIASADIDLRYETAAGERWRGRFTARDLDHPELSVDRLTLRGQGTIAEGAGADLGRFSADLDYAATGLTLTDPAQARALGSDIRGSLRFARQEGEPFEVEALTLRGAGLSAQANATVRGPDVRFRTRTAARITAEDFGRFSGLVGRPLQGDGQIALSGRLQPFDGIFDIDLSARTGDLGLGIAQVDPLLTGETRLSLRAARNESGTRLDDLDLRGEHLSADASAEITGDAASGTVAARITDMGRIDSALQGPGTFDADLRTDAAGVVTTEAVLIAPDTRLDADVTATPEGAGYAVTGLAVLEAGDLSRVAGLTGLRLGGAMTLEARGDYATETGAAQAGLTVTTQNLRAGPAGLDPLLRGAGELRAEFDQGPTGRIALSGLRARFPNISADGDVDIADDGLARADLDLRLADVGLLAPDFAGPATARIEAAQDARGWQVSGSGSGPAGTTGQADGRIGNDGQLALNLVGQAPLGLANAFIAPRQISGLARYDLSVNGPPRPASLSGAVTLSDGRLTAPNLGQAIEALSGRVRVNSGLAQLDLTGDLAAGGQIVAGGSIGLSTPNTADLRLELQRARLRDPALYETRATGTIRVTGPLRGGARLSGGVALGRTEIRVPSSPVSTLGDLPRVTHKAPGRAVRRTLGRAGLGTDPGTRGGNGAGGRPYPLDLQIDAPARIFVRGRGLDAELGGALRLTGTTAAVRPIGRFELLRGRLDILGQRFDLTEGYAELQGDFTPYLRLVARTEARSGTDVSIIIEGPADNPEVRFESSPELPQDEVLAQLLFGRDLSAISPLQAVQLASAVATLSGRGGGGALEGLREGLDLDDFDITTDEDGNAAVRAGKYISENVYTDITVGADGTSGVNLNLDVTDDVTARGSFGSEGESSLGIFYERDY
ncbi:MAG: translocation/assembly module TamB domain-containing protein [Salibaculum sp.]|uniref:translocation/assembly module TamB domain-containing protein n=1 Tax=Salibaculum sp. TaxID=2855480 RepID=UPI0028704EB6|nr:translocation/assembly module TamB domain-containing protein [Salibaculum sp.]MDR9427434.1 translocation/assembly module TamB domain-containing protein [Salibaculum sp.]